MNIEALSGGQSLFQMMGAGGAGRQGPPSSEDIAAKMTDALESGNVDGAEIQSRLSERFGEDADGILQEDGSLDTDKLASLLDANRPDVSGGKPPGVGGKPEGVGDEGSETSEMLHNFLEQLEESSEQQSSLVDQLYGQVAKGPSTNEELFSILA